LLTNSRAVLFPLQTTKLSKVYWGFTGESKKSCILEERPLRPFGSDPAEVKISCPRSQPAAGGPVQKALLDEERLNHILYGVALLADGCCESLKSDRAAAELVDNGKQNRAVHAVEPHLIDFQELQRLLHDLFGDCPVRKNLGKIPDAAQQPVGNPRRTPAAAGQLQRCCIRDRDIEDTGRAPDNEGEFVIGIEFKPGDDPETVPERRRQQPCPGRCPDKGESGEIELDRPCAWPLTDDDVELKVLHGRVEYLFDRVGKPVDLIYEENVMRFDIGEDCGKIAVPLYYRP